MDIKEGKLRPGLLLRWQALKNILKTEIKENAVVLDIGGYDGFVASRLLKIVPNLDITVVDINRLGLEKAKNGGLKVLCASACNLPLEDKTVDFIICLDLIEHISKHAIAIKEMSRVLKKDGKIILTTPMENGITFPFMTNERIISINHDFGHVRLGYTKKNIRNIFENSGFVIDKIDKYFNFLSRFGYWLISYSDINIKRKYLFFLYKLIIKLEPHIKFGAEEHIVIANRSML